MSVEAFDWRQRACGRYLVSVAWISAFAIATTACTRPPPQPRTGPAATVEPPPVCAGYDLLFAPPYLPTDIALSPDGKLLAVADRGILTVRDAETLRVHRYLEPYLNAWTHVRFIEAGKVLVAETDDGLQAEFDTATWQMRTPPTQPRGQEQDYGDTVFLVKVSVQRSDFLLRYSHEFWTHVTDLPALGPDVTPTAFEFSLIDETGWTAQLRDYQEKLDALTQEQLRTVVATSAGEIRILDHGGKVLIRRPVAASGAIAKLQVTGGHLVAGTASGEVIVLTRELAEVARAQVLRPGDIEDARLKLLRSEPLPSDSFLRFQYDPVAQRIFWISTSFRTGVFDLKTRRSLAELPATALPGTTRLTFLDTRTLAALSSGGLWIWDIVSGQSEWHAAGPFTDAVLGGKPGIVAASEDGHLTLYRRDDGEVVRRACILPDGCEAKTGEDAAGFAAFQQATGLLAYHRIWLEPAPDPRYVLVLHQPIGFGSYEGAPTDTFQVWSADLTERVQSFALDECQRPSLVVTADAVQACDMQFHATTFQPIPGSEDEAPLSPEEDTSFPLAYGTLEVTEDSAMIYVGDISIEPIAEKYYESSPPRTAQRLSDPHVAVTADGKLLALAGSPNDMLSWSGPVQVWCAPVPGQFPGLKE